MAQRVNVTSIESLEFFRTSLIIYLEKASQALDEIGEEVKRTKQWLEHDQRIHWEGQVRLASRKLDQAQQELYSATLSKTTSRSQYKTAVARLKRAREESQAKLKTVQQWSRKFDSVVQPRAKKLETLRYTLGHDMSKATAFMAQALKSLEEYAELTPTGKSAPEAQSTPKGAAQDDPPAEAEDK